MSKENLVFIYVSKKEKSVWNIYEMAFSLRQESSVFQKDRLLVKSFLYFVRPCILYNTTNLVFFLYNTRNLGSSLFQNNFENENNTC